MFAAGTKIHYYHEQDYDINKIYIPGPTTKTLTIVVRCDLQANDNCSSMNNSSRENVWICYLNLCHLNFFHK